MSAARTVVLGLGKMGSAMALRLREHGHAISMWNRTQQKGDVVRAALLPGDCTLHATAAAAIQASASDSAVLLVLSNADATLEVISSARDALRGRTVVNLTSGSPSFGREICRLLTGPEVGVAAYVDAAYCGPPTKARQGQGVLFLSADDEAHIRRHDALLSLLGEVAFCGRVGASRAVDYAVVDLALVCYASFISNIEMLELEEAERELLHTQIAKRLATVPAALQSIHERCAERTEMAYKTAPVVTLRTLHDWWTSRRPYFDEHAIPPHVPSFMAKLCETAAGGPDGEHWTADVTRLQEILRPLHTHESTGRALTDERDAKKARRALSPQCMPFAADFQVVDVFSERIYGGNPTCVCFVPSVSDVSVESLGRAAREMRQPTTSFVDAASGEYRTFGANGLELPYLSAHSTLGVGAALMARSGLAEHRLHGKGGPVTVRRAGKCFELALVQPTEPLVQPTELAPLAHALGIDRTTAIAHGALLGDRFFFVELPPVAFSQIKPVHGAIEALPCAGLIAVSAGHVAQQAGYTPECLMATDGLSSVTPSAATSSGVTLGAGTAETTAADFTCRYFAPKLGIDEDVATGSIQPPLHEYWRARLDKAKGEALLCLQASRRGGYVWSRCPGDGYAYVAGHAMLSFSGTLPLCND